MSADHPTKNPALQTNLKHGGVGTRLYSIWINMKQRCYNPRRYGHHGAGYETYGGRGITVCDEWRDDFASFRDWALANGYRDDLTLDRYPDNDGHYSPDNCRWATPLEQGGNTRRCKLVTAFGETKTIRQWGKDPRCVVHTITIARRIRAGIDPEAAMTTPSADWYATRRKTTVP